MYSLVDLAVAMEPGRDVRAAVGRPGGLEVGVVFPDSSKPRMGKGLFLFWLLEI